MEEPRMLQVLYDRQGAILSATFVPRPASNAGARPVPRTGVIPDTKAGQQVAELQVPNELAELQLHELAEQLHVDISSKQPKLVYRKKQ